MSKIAWSDSGQPFLPGGAGDTRDSPAKLRGAYIGIVTANDTKEAASPPSTYAVCVRFPWLSGNDNSTWARVLSPMTGPDRGAYFLPEIDDQVVIVFEHGDISRPIVVGALWSQKQPPPEENAENNFRVIKSRSGHRIILDDTDGGERVILVDSTGDNKIVLDSAKKTITVQSKSGDIAVKAPAGKVLLHGNDVKLSSQAKTQIKASTKLQVATKGELGAKAGSELALKGTAVQLNPDGFG